MRQFIQGYCGLFCSLVEVPSTFRTIATDDHYQTKYHYVKFPNTIFQFGWTHNSTLDSVACWLTNEPVQFENHLLKINEVLSLDNYNFAGTLCLPSKEKVEIRDKKLDANLCQKEIIDLYFYSPFEYKTITSTNKLFSCSFEDWVRNPDIFKTVKTFKAEIFQTAEIPVDANPFYYKHLVIQ